MQREKCRAEDAPFDLVVGIADGPIVSRMRLVIAVAMLLTFVIEQRHSSLSNESVDIAAILLAAYFLHSAFLCVSAEFGRAFLHSRSIHWLDVLWFALIVWFNGCVHSIFYLSFLFAILISSFRWGLEEGGRVAIASALLLAAGGLLSYVPGDLPILLLRIVFLLALGYLSAYLGESSLRLKRQLILLRDVSKLANPRFGVEQTMNLLLQKTLEFFDGASCILVLHLDATKTCELRTIKKGDQPAVDAMQIDAVLTQSLLGDLPENVVLCRSRPLSLFFRSADLILYDLTQKHWLKQKIQAGDPLAAMLEAPTFISVPIALRKGHGRLYVTSLHGGFDKDDALFLQHICAQAFPVIENIELLDQIASRSAIRERQRIALDIHDTTIQPYIGLQLGLCAMQKKAAADNPLLPDLHQLIAMSTEVIGGLRQFARTFDSSAEATVKIMEEVVQRYAQQSREFYGIVIAVSIDANLKINDRLAAEVLQIVSEGLSNIRRHTRAKSGAVRIACRKAQLSIDINNAADGSPPSEFIPRSITQRAIDLGGNAHVLHAQDDSTSIVITIPI